MEMDIPKVLPILYTTPFLLPGYLLKIQLPVKDNHNLLIYLLDKDENNQLSNFIGVIPKIDLHKESNVIGAVGLVQSIIQLDNAPEVFFLVVQGIIRFKLGPTIL
ncbi:uncharacterized protein LOC126837172 [Adelges cooleyi]|uniref:uncharacterized protein LOC126837172 n=1 Tax=Adelges cooleyi TaxID=133065 RepID=UPI00217FC412|nr:uncharacterized protein LOC126837172 [Adelges cooleyi]